MKRRLGMLLAIVVMASCLGAPPSVSVVPIPPKPDKVRPFPVSRPSEDFSWWDQSVFYEIFVRTFQDSDGDAKGDLRGLIDRLDYLNDGHGGGQSLGVTGIWLMPVFEARSGHGYDQTDYYKIAEDYGSNEDFKLLVGEAHKRGIRVIVDLVLNHTSEQHPWFVSQVKEPDGPNRDFYLFSDKPFPAHSHKLSPEGGGFFYGRFGPTQPDLNFTNPRVTDEMFKVTEFWLKEFDLDGFRLDAIKYLIEEGRSLDNTASTHEWFKRFYRFYKSIRPQAFTVGEVWDTLPAIRSYTGDQVDMGFLFPLSEALADAVRSQSGARFRGVMDEVLDTFPPGQYATFLKNHDQKRLIKELSGELAKVRLAAAMQLTLPGVPFVYYGEEIGLFENRRAMQWDAREKNYGFTSNDRNFGGFAPEKDISVAAQQADPDSLWRWYKDLISLRMARSELRTGVFAPVETGNSGVVAWLRSDTNGNSLMIVNLTTKPVNTYGLTLWNGPFVSGISEAKLIFPLTEAAKTAVPASGADGGFEGWKPLSALPAQSFHVFQLR